MIELLNSKTTVLPNAADGKNRFAIDGHIGAVQMRADASSPWQDIKPRLVRDTEGWHIEGAPYDTKMLADGTRLIIPDKEFPSKYLRLPAVALFKTLTKQIESTAAKLDGEALPNVVKMLTPWGWIAFLFTNTGVHFEVMFNQDPKWGLSPRINLDMDSTLDIISLLKATSGLGIPRPRLMELGAGLMEAKERWLDWSLKSGQLELGLDFSGLKFPVLLKNTTIDKQVGASADDGYVETSGSFYATAAYLPVGGTSIYGDLASWYRYTGITIAQGSTILSPPDGNTYLSLYEYYSAGSPLTKIWADDQNNPAAPTTRADYLSRTQTSAGVDEDGDPGANGWHNTADVGSVIQELVTSYAYNNQAIQILHKNDGSDAFVCRQSYSYDQTGNVSGPKIHIEYSAGGGGPANISKFDGIAKASIGKIDGIAIASISKVCGV